MEVRCFLSRAMLLLLSSLILSVRAAQHVPAEGKGLLHLVQRAFSVVKYSGVQNRHFLMRLSQEL